MLTSSSVFWNGTDRMGMPFLWMWRDFAGWKGGGSAQRVLLVLMEAVSVVMTSWFPFSKNLWRESECRRLCVGVFVLMM